MSAQNLQLARLAFAGLSAADRRILLRELAGAPDQIEADHLVRVREAAGRLACTPRTVFSLLKSGALTRVKLPGRTRGAGIRESEISALIGKTTQ
jgi:hypothetical protein